MTSSPGHWAIDLDDRVAEIRCSTVRDGDFHIDGPRAALLHRRQAFAPGVWTQLDEVHGIDVVAVAAPGQHDFAVGDALITRALGAVLAVWVGDCAPVVLAGADGTVGAAHAGWRGALDGVLPAVVAAMGTHAAPVRAWLGPCIHPCCYEFGVDELEQFRRRFGPSVVGVTSWGTPALDVPAVARASLLEVGVQLHDVGQCTGCHADRYWSYRRRAQAGRQVMTICTRARA